MNSDWPFTETENVAVITTSRVVQEGRAILLVIHDEDGEWQFLDGGEVRAEDGMVVSLGNIVRRDNSLTSLANLRVGWQAWRENIHSSWNRERIS